MADGNLSQSEADDLIAMEKVRVNDSDNSYPVPGGKLIVPLTSRDGREDFTWMFPAAKSISQRLRIRIAPGRSSF